MEINLKKEKPISEYKFDYDEDGYYDAIRWLKEIGLYEYISTHGQSVDGWSIIHTANAMWEQKLKNNNHD
jgi:hypothetical protein